MKNPFLHGWGTQQQDSTSTAIPAVPENRGFLREERDIPNTSPAPAEFHHILFAHKPLKSITTINLWLQEPLPAASSLLKGQGKPGRSRAYSRKSSPCLAVKGGFRYSGPDWNNPDYHKTSPALHRLISLGNCEEKRNRRILAMKQNLWGSNF